MQADGFVFVERAASQMRNKFELLSLNLKSAYLNLILLLLLLVVCNELLPCTRSSRYTAGGLRQKHNKT